jgi:hypothetical protein
VLTCTISHAFFPFTYICATIFHFYRWQFCSILRSQCGLKKIHILGLWFIIFMGLKKSFAWTTGLSGGRIIIHIICY